MKTILFDDYSLNPFLLLVYAIVYHLVNMFCARYFNYFYQFPSSNLWYMPFVETVTITGRIPLLRPIDAHKAPWRGSGCCRDSNSSGKNLN